MSIFSDLVDLIIPKMAPIEVLILPSTPLPTFPEDPHLSPKDVGPFFLNIYRQYCRLTAKYGKGLYILAVSATGKNGAVAHIEEQLVTIK